MHLDFQNDRVYVSVNAIQLYYLPCDMQRDILIMLAMAQRPKLLRTGVLPLSLDTFVGVSSAKQSNLNASKAHYIKLEKT